MTVDDDGESLADPVTDAQPYPARRIEADDFDSDLSAEVFDQPLGQLVGPLGVFAEQFRCLFALLVFQGFHRVGRERLSASRSTGLKDRGKKAQQLDPRWSGHDRLRNVVQT